MATPLIDKSSLEIKVGGYSVGNAIALTDPLLISRVQDYKRQTSSRMQPLDRSEVSRKIPTAEFHASRKIDGEFTVLVYRDSQALMLNPGGTVRMGLPAIEEAISALSSAGIKDALIAGELHVVHDGGKRERIHDVVSLARAPESAADLDRLHFSVFDLMEVNGDSSSVGFGTTWKKITDIFGKGHRARPVPMSIAKNAGDVEVLFKDHVEKDGAEGLVLRSDSAGIFKLKLRHTLDAVIVGFTESTGERAGMIHDLLVALRRQDGTLHILCRVGGGFSDDLRRTLLADLKDRIVESEYAEVNSDHVAYQMVEPRTVVEISFLDLISQSTRGATINRMTLDWDASAKSYRIVRRLPLVSVISPQFVRFREDKTSIYADIRIDQVASIVEVPHTDRDARQMTLPSSEVLRREVFVKAAKGETMVRKFVMWKTNKELVSSEHPAYVVHYTDFSPNRATPMSREVRVSSSREQIEALYERLKEENIKKGWEPASKPSVVAVSEPAPAALPATPEPPVTSEIESEPVKPPAASKKAAKKAASKKAAAEKSEPEKSEPASESAPEDRPTKRARKK